MIASSFLAIAAGELRLRSRRWSSLIVLLVVLVIGWSMVVDPASGRTMVVVAGARAIYDSATLALGSAAPGGILLGLAAFYLVRGRTREDLRCGLGGVLGAAPVSNASFLFARWLGAMGWLGVVVLALMAMMMAQQLVHGEAPLRPPVFLQTYALMLLPTLIFAASLACLSDAVPWLMGKRGDVLYFGLWIGQFSLAPRQMERIGGLQWLNALDVSGMSVVVQRVRELTGSTHFAIGRNSYDMSKATVALDNFWTAETVALRVASMLLAALPLLLAIAFFHRYAPDRVKAAHAARRGSPWAWANRLLGPAARVVKPLFPAAARLPGFAGQLLADLALVFVSQPVAVVALAGLAVAGVAAPAAVLPGVLLAAAAVWGIIVSDVASRDHEAGADAMSAAAPGGARRRHFRQWLVTWLVALLLALPVLLRLVATQPAAALHAALGFLALAGIASALGQVTRTGRAFLGLFLFFLYLSVQVKGVNWFDPLGINGAADMKSLAAWMLAGLAAVAASFALVVRRAR